MATPGQQTASPITITFQHVSFLCCKRRGFIKFLCECSTFDSECGEWVSITTKGYAKLLCEIARLHLLKWIFFFKYKFLHMCVHTHYLQTYRSKALDFDLSDTVLKSPVLLETFVLLSYVKQCLMNLF